MIGFDFSTTYGRGNGSKVTHTVRFFKPCKMACRIVEQVFEYDDGPRVATRIVYQRGSKHGRRYETATSFEEARKRVTAWVRRNAKEWAS